LQARSEFLEAEVTQSSQPQFGDYQCNSALKLGKALKQNPRSIAEKLAQHLREVGRAAALIQGLDIAGPGFINITLSSEYLALKPHAILTDERLGIPLPAKRQKIIVEFSSPNIAKELHVGH